VAVAGLAVVAPRRAGGSGFKVGVLKVSATEEDLPYAEPVAQCSLLGLLDVVVEGEGRVGAHD
jgi:hypothetical protein